MYKINNDTLSRQTLYIQHINIEKKRKKEMTNYISLHSRSIRSRSKASENNIDMKK